MPLCSPTLSQTMLPCPPENPLCVYLALLHTGDLAGVVLSLLLLLITSCLLMPSLSKLHKTLVLSSALTKGIQ